MGNKEYALEKVNESKIRKPKLQEKEKHYEYKIGDRVNLLDNDDFGIIYKEIDNSITSLYIITVNSLK